MSKVNVKSEYDVAIIGSGISAFLTAALVSKKHRVLLVTDKESAEDGLATKVESPGFPLFGSNRNAVFNLLLQELRIFGRKGDFVVEVDVPYQFVSKSYRIDFHHDLSMLRDEFRRELPDYHVDDLLGMIQRAGLLSNKCLRLLPDILPYLRTRKEGMLDQYLHQFGLDKELLEQNVLHDKNVRNQGVGHFLVGSLMAGSLVSPEHWWGGASHYAISRFMSDRYRIRGGLRRLRNILYEYISQFRGDVVWEKVESLDAGFRDLKKIKLADSGESIGVRCASLHTSVPRALELTPSKWKKWEYSSKAKGVTCPGYRMSSEWMMRDRVIPVGMCERGVLTWSSDLGFPKYDEIMLYEFSDPDDAMAAPRGYRKLKVTFRIDAAKRRELIASGEWYGYLTSLDRSVQERMEWLMPFMRSGIHVYFPLNIRYGTEAAGKCSAAAEIGIEAEYGFGGMQVDTAYRNLFFGGDSLLPAFGLDGQLNSGWNLARCINENLSR